MRAKYADRNEAVRHLEVGDIVLFRHRREHALIWLIEKTSGSRWTHTALIFHVADLGGFDRDIILIEANSAGIEMHRLSIYLNNPLEFELGFKRMKNLSQVERERFRGFFLDALDTPYDVRRLKVFFLNVMLARVFGINFEPWFVKQAVNQDNYLCTTFAQRAYYLAVAPEKRASTLFRGPDAGLNFLEQMELITPAQIANSKNTIWLYHPH